MGPTEQQMGGDTGDIIISSAPDKPKVSRPLMLGIIIGVLVLVGGAVAAVVLLSQQKGGNGQIAAYSSADLYASFSDYAVYIVGSEEAYDEGFDINRSYTLNDVLYSDSEEDQEVYLNVAIQKFNNVIDNYNKIGLNGDNLGELLENNLEGLKFLDLYVKTSMLTGQEIYDKAQNDGADVARTYVSEHYSAFSNSSSAVANNFADLAIEFGDAVISDSSDSSARMTDAINGMNSLVNSTVSGIVDNCWVFKTYIENVNGAKS